MSPGLSTPEVSPWDAHDSQPQTRCVSCHWLGLPYHSPGSNCRPPALEAASLRPRVLWDHPRARLDTAALSPGVLPVRVGILSPLSRAPAPAWGSHQDYHLNFLTLGVLGGQPPSCGRQHLASTGTAWWWCLGLGTAGWWCVGVVLRPLGSSASGPEANAPMLQQAASLPLPSSVNTSSLSIWGGHWCSTEVVAWLPHIPHRTAWPQVPAPLPVPAPC